MALHISINNVNSESSAIELIQSAHFIAVSTKTANGLACFANKSDLINKFCLIRLLNKHTSLSVCIGKVTDVQKWPIVSLLPDGLLSSLLRGPVTLVLNCANKLSLHCKFGIHIPDYSIIASDLQCPITFSGANVRKQRLFKIKEYQS